ncbi:hypothetical protein MYCTH_2307045 [Thermothelomyces thermophilus ATCC 42464]|uniref:Uncharacterized protein n=1 Tax=Thermothelomyces thermophilus (strain ATCC 42464 / BCRC 31852 / DSM 1799) TaxID=573729 RepID=G2QF54_THET4|nr:uncharacterized protein MYCTH_2307045 [Thermothelomyces thermophilus ATCC 42464]AEO59083.1 hypothetical protein MYCTH_2307045 [Thermothelomyces thermophilus ATCC 42464]
MVNDEGARGGPPFGSRAEARSCISPQCRRREGMLKAEIDRLTAEIQRLEGQAGRKAEEIRQLSRDKSALEEANKALRDALTAKLERARKHHKRVRSDPNP